MNHKFQYFLHFRMRQRTAVAVNAPLTPPQYLLPAPAKGGLPQTNTFGKRPHLCLRGFSERWYPWDQPWANDGWSLRIILHRSTLRYRGPREDQRSLTRTVTCLMINASLRSAFSFVSYFPTCSNFTYLSNFSQNHLLNHAFSIVLGIASKGAKLVLGVGGWGKKSYSLYIWSPDINTVHKGYTVYLWY